VKAIKAYDSGYQPQAATQITVAGGLIYSRERVWYQIP